MAMGENPDKFIDICFTAPTLALIYGDSVALEASKNDLKSFNNLIIVEGCRTGCASMMLDAMEIEPSARIYLSFAHREKTGFAVTSKDDAAINDAIPEVVDLILNAESKC
jgi:hypothetical protein